MGVCICAWEAVIWCMGVGVKAHKMRIVIIFVPSIQPINNFNGFKHKKVQTNAYLF